MSVEGFDKKNIIIFYTVFNDFEELNHKHSSAHAQSHPGTRQAFVEHTKVCPMRGPNLQHVLHSGFKKTSTSLLSVESKLI